MPTPGPWPLDRRKPAPPAAQPPCHQHGAGQREHQQRQRRHRRGIAPGVTHQERAVKVGQPTLHRALIGAGNVQPHGRVHHRSPGHISVKPVGTDLARGRAADLLHPRMRRQHQCRQIANGLPAHLDRRGQSLYRREQRQGRPAEREGKDQSRSQQAGLAVKLAKHGAGPIRNRR